MIQWNAWRNAVIKISQLEAITRNLNLRKNNGPLTYETDEEEFMSQKEINEFSGTKRNLKRKAIKLTVTRLPQRNNIKMTNKEKTLKVFSESLSTLILSMASLTSLLLEQKLETQMEK